MLFSFRGFALFTTASVSVLSFTSALSLLIDSVCLTLSFLRAWSMRLPHAESDDDTSNLASWDVSDKKVSEVADFNEFITEALHWCFLTDRVLSSANEDVSECDTSVTLHLQTFLLCWSVSRSVTLWLSSIDDIQSSKLLCCFFIAWLQAFRKFWAESRMNSWHSELSEMTVKSFSLRTSRFFKRLVYLHQSEQSIVP